ncbi:MAG: hypothetical protein JSS58_00595 [Proteobacteria bacterium]|nr:hypothetical protein [Pseudomonadota bacterium]
MQSKLFDYLRVMLPMPLFAWFWSGQALQKLGLEWTRTYPTDLRGMEATCHAIKMAGCEAYLPVTLTHGLALLLLLSLLGLVLIAASMPTWPQAWQQAVMKKAGLLGGIGLTLTFLMIAGRGALSALAVWFIPKVWWGYDALAAAAIIGTIALIRIPPHAIAAWTLAFKGQPQCVGKLVTPEESPRLWQLIDDTCRELGIASPTHLVVGLTPDCRLHTGKLRLLPENSLIAGDVLYLGATLSDTLHETALRMLLRQALSRRHGRLGAWFPAVEDWLNNAEKLLQATRNTPQRMESAAAPAYACRAGWLAIVQSMLSTRREEYDHAMQSHHAQSGEHLASDAILTHAREIWRIQVLPRLMLGLSNGNNQPRVMAWFAAAMDARDAANPPAHDDPALSRELVLLERQWLVESGQITVLD